MDNGTVTLLLPGGMKARWTGAFPSCIELIPLVFGILKNAIMIDHSASVSSRQELQSETLSASTAIHFCVDDVIDPDQNQSVVQCTYRIL